MHRFVFPVYTRRTTRLRSRTSNTYIPTCIHFRNDKEQKTVEQKNLFGQRALQGSQSSGRECDGTAWKEAIRTVARVHLMKFIFIADSQTRDTLNEA